MDWLFCQCEIEILVNCFCGQFEAGIDEKKKKWRCIYGFFQAVTDAESPSRSFINEKGDISAQVGAQSASSSPLVEWSSHHLIEGQKGCCRIGTAAAQSGGKGDMFFKDDFDTIGTSRFRRMIISAAR